jgi:hypothetical protein
VRGRWSGKQQIEAGYSPGDAPVVGLPAGADGAQPNAALARNIPHSWAIRANPVGQCHAGSAASSREKRLALEAARNSGFRAQPRVAIRDAKSIHLNSSCVDARRALEKSAATTRATVEWKTNAHPTEVES